MKVGQSLGHVVGDVYLNVEREWGRVLRSLQEAGQALVHQLHQKNRQPGLGVARGAQELDDVGVPDSAQEVALLLEALDDAAGGRVPGCKEDGVQNLGGTGELVALGLVDSAIGANAEAVGLTLDELNTAVAETTLNAQLLSHDWERGRGRRLRKDGSSMFVVGGALLVFRLQDPAKFVRYWGVWMCVYIEVPELHVHT